MSGGMANISGSGGSFALTGGSGAGNGAGGQFTLTSGNGAGSGNAGGIGITGGSATSGTAGTITLTPGTATSAANDGQIILRTAGGVNALILDQYGNILCSCVSTPSATDGFSYLGNVTNTPTGVPAHTSGPYANSTPVRFDTTNNILWAYNFPGWVDVANQMTAPTSVGTKFTASGCSNTATVGGATAGEYASGTTGTCTVLLTLPTAPNGWSCVGADITTPADTVTQTTRSTTSCTLSGTTTSGDTIVWHAFGY